jgi:hypothetical protein
MKKALKTRDNIVVLKKIIKAAAKKFKVEPHELNKIQFMEQLGEDVSEWEVRKLGGFEGIRDRFFPAPKNNDKPTAPWATKETSKMHGHELSAYIANCIGECAKEYQVNAHELTWYEFRRWANINYGGDDEGIGIYNITRAGGFNQIRDAYFARLPTAITVDKRRLFDHTKLNRRLGNVFAERQFVMEGVEEFSKRVFAGKVEAVKVLKGAKTMDRVVSALWSDLHIGSDVCAEETGFQTFGKKEESRRLAALTKQVCSYKQQYREHSRLNLYLLGDIIQNSLHDARDGAVLAEQYARAVHLLSQAIAQLSASYPKVDVWCATGNHGRNKARHFERATHQKWDSIETMIYVALKYACEKLANVDFHIPKTPYIQVPVLGSLMFGTHGDTVLKPGTPGKAINMKNLENQINKINASLPDQQEYGVFFVGHVHTPSMTFLDNGSVMITNGCMVPVDEFAVSIGVIESHCGQFVWESIKGYPVGDVRLIKVGREDDENAALDKIIKPWEKL